MKFFCDHCEQKIEADRTLSGSIMICPTCSQAFRVPDYGLIPGDRLDGFVLRKRIGSGGMGDVWLADQESMQRECAVKVLSPDLTVHQEFINRFMQEVKSTGKLQHTNIVTSYYAGESDGIYYLAMECVSGENLDAILDRDRQMDETTVLKVARSAANALEYAWEEQKLIHRDIKPSNIMIDDTKTVKILDFGIAKSLDANNTSHLTQTGAILGTPYYMSPEQASRKIALDCRSDIYSMGAVMYHLLSGEPPFQGDTPVGILAQHLSGTSVPLRRMVPNISPPTAALVEKMMQKDPARRFQNWGEVRKEIDRILQGKKAIPLKYVIPVGAAAVILLAVLVIVKLSNKQQEAKSLSVQQPGKSSAIENPLNTLDKSLAELDDLDVGAEDNHSTQSSKSASATNSQVQREPGPPPSRLQSGPRRRPGMVEVEGGDENRLPDPRFGPTPSERPMPDSQASAKRSDVPGLTAINTLEKLLIKTGLPDNKVSIILDICIQRQKDVHDQLREKVEGRITPQQFREKMFSISQKTQERVRNNLTKEEFAKFKSAYKTYFESLKKSIMSHRIQPRRRRWR
jgi:serine/threonine protein kinase